MTVEEVEKKLTDLETDLGNITKRAERAEAIVKINSEDRAVFDTLSKEDQDKYLGGDTQVLETAKEELSKTDEDDKAEMPEEIQKKFEDIKKQLDAANVEIAKANKAAADEREKREEMEFSKRAETEFGELPGESIEKGKVLKACASKLTKEEFEGVTKLFEAGNAALKQLGVAIGKDGSDATSNDAYNVIEKKAKALAAETKISFEKAFDKVISEDPKLYDKYMEQQSAASRK